MQINSTVLSKLKAGTSTSRILSGNSTNSTSNSTTSNSTSTNDEATDSSAEDTPTEINTEPSVTPSPGTVNNVTISHYDVTTNSYVYAAATVTNNNTLTINLTHFSIYGVVADIQPNLTTTGSFILISRMILILFTVLFL